MRRRRSEIFGKGYEELTRLIEDNTYGGYKQTKRQIPIMSNSEGIKISWQCSVDKYPTEVQIKMSDEKWVTYQMKVEQPDFQGERKYLRYESLSNELDEVRDDRRRISVGMRGLIPDYGKEEEFERLTRRIEEIQKEMRDLRYGKAV